MIKQPRTRVANAGMRSGEMPGHQSCHQTSYSKALGLILSGGPWPESPIVRTLCDALSTESGGVTISVERFS
jgi:hypothetical protein